MKDSELFENLYILTILYLRGAGYSQTSAEKITNDLSNIILLHYKSINKLTIGSFSLDSLNNILKNVNSVTDESLDLLKEVTKFEIKMYKTKNANTTN